MMPKNQSTRIDDLLASVTPDMIADPPTFLKESGVRVERILLDLLRPDPVQPRRVLPERIHMEFHHQRLTPSQALRELVQIAQVAARQRARPFHNVLELLPNGESETEDDTVGAFSPEEILLRDLVNLAVTIRDDGQVNPLTVVDISQGVTRMYRIETGERRYWATWLLRDFVHASASDGMVPCIVIPEQKSSVFRQARENTARAGLSAIAMARQAALLLLTVHGYEIPAYPVGNDYYRQALTLDFKSRQEHTDTVLAAMGGINRRHFSRYKMLLNLSDEALELADRHNLDEFRLRPILALEPELHVEMVQHIIDLNLSGRQVQQIVDQGMQVEEEPAHPTVSKKARTFVRFVKSVEDKDVEEYASALLEAEKHRQLAIARLDALMMHITAVRKRLSEEA